MLFIRFGGEKRQNFFLGRFSCFRCRYLPEPFSELVFKVFVVQRHTGTSLFNP